MPDEKAVGAGVTTDVEAYDAMSKAWVEAETSEGTQPAAVATPPAETPPADPPAAVATPPAEPPAVVATPPAEPTPEERIATLEAENAKLKTAPTPAPVAPAAAAPAPAAPAPEAPPPEFKNYEYNDEEKAALAKFEKEWPEIAAAQKAFVGQKVHDAVTHVFNQFNRVYGPFLQQLMAGQETLSDEQILTFLRTQHSDYDTQVEPMIKWADTLSGTAKVGAKSIIAEGTPQQVAALMAEFKTATGVKTVAAPPATPAAPAAPAAAAPKAPVVQISDAARKAAEKLAPTTGKRSSVAGTVDKNDFEGAWSEAMAEEQRSAAK